MEKSERHEKDLSFNGSIDFKGSIDETIDVIT
jgi:hypothetical protein